MGRHNLRRRESGECGDVPEGDLDLLGEGLGEDGVPGDGGGDEGVGGDQTGEVGQLTDPSDTTGEGLGGEGVLLGASPSTCAQWPMVHVDQGCKANDLQPPPAIVHGFG